MADATTTPTPEQQAALQKIADDAGVDADMLVNGNALRDASTESDVLDLLTEANLDHLTRHLATLEGTERLTTLVISKLGLAAGLDLTKPSEIMAYARMIVGVDVLPAQQEPGTLLCDGNYKPMHPRNLAHEINQVISAAASKQREKARASYSGNDKNDDSSEVGGVGGDTMSRYHSTVVTAIR